jgi:nicotinamide-nucleotide amidase
METITRIKYIDELEAKIGKEKKQSQDISSYNLLHSYTRKIIKPLIIKKNVKVSTVELTTCGLLSDLLTSTSGASNYFIIGMIPYSNEMKIKIGFPKKELLYGGYGVVSKQAAETLARSILVYSGADVGIAETGLLTSSELKKKRTQKEAGCVFASIISKNDSFSKKLSVQGDLERKEMRHEIAFRVLCLLEDFLKR